MLAIPSLYPCPLLKPGVVTKIGEIGAKASARKRREREKGECFIEKRRFRL